jgi:type IV secretion system protein VirB8
MDEDARQYFEEASRWDADRSELLRASARRAWQAAAVAAALAAIAAVALAVLTPLKRVDAFVIRVDNSTGIVDVVPRYSGGADLPETVTRQLVRDYVTQRERYIPALAESDYEQVGAFHSAPMNQRWAAAWARSNPESPLNRYADGTHVRVQIQSIAFLKQAQGAAATLQVRFATATERSIGAAEDWAHYVATLETVYGPPSGDVRLRALNPLGFKVLEYQREPEVPGTSGPGPTAGASR